MSQIVVFIDGTADYLDVHEMTDSVIRGWVINGHWELYIDRVNRMVFLDQSQETDGSVLEPLHSYTSLEIEPVTRSGDYNRVIELATERKILRDRKG